MDTYSKLDSRLACFENRLNTLGYIPVVSTVSGVVRAGYALGESLIGKVTAAFKACQYFLSRNPQHRQEAANNYWYSVHGDMNAVRASFELIPVAGNVATFFYDFFISLRANYTYEKLPRCVDPIFESKTREPERLFSVDPLIQSSVDQFTKDLLNAFLTV